MKNYKQHLYYAIREEASDPENMNEYSQDFINDYDATYNDYFCDAFSAFADNNTSIYYNQIRDFMKNNIEAVNDAINEFGWDGCGCDLYKAGQMAEYMQIERELYDDFDDIKKCLALDLIDSTSEADDEAERIFDTLTDEEKDELTSDFLAGLEAIDNNDRINEIESLYEAFIQSILDKEENE